jgi:hypothetical protein
MVAAMQLLREKMRAQRSSRVAMRRQSFHCQPLRITATETVPSTRHPLNYQKSTHLQIGLIFHNSWHSPGLLKN